MVMMIIAKRPAVVKKVFVAVKMRDEILYY